MFLLLYTVSGNTLEGIKKEMQSIDEKTAFLEGMIKMLGD